MSLSGNVDLLAARVGTEVKAVRTEFVPKTLFDAKGDIIAGSADNTPAKLTVGANDRLLMADSAQAAGLKWATAAQVKAALAYTPADIGAQTADATLTALAGLATGADKLPYSTGTDTFSQTDLSSFGRSLIDDADAAAARTTIGLGSVTNDAQVKLSTATTKGDIYTATASATVGRKAVGTTNNDMFIVDSAQSDGLRWDASRGSDLGYARDALGLLCCSSMGVISGSTFGMSASIRTLELLVGRLPSGTPIGSIRIYTTTAMSGGTATIALYESSTLNGTSWARIGSNVTCTTTLQAAAGRQSITYSASPTGDNWIRVQLVLSSTAPSVYPVFAAGLLPLVTTVVGGHVINGYSNGTTVPGATINPSTGWTDPGYGPAFGLAA